MELVDDLEPVTDSRRSEGSRAFAAICIGLKHPFNPTGSSGFRE